MLDDVFRFMEVARTEITDKNILDLGYKDVAQISDGTKDRVHELGLKSLAGKLPNDTKLVTELSRQVTKLGQDLSKHVHVKLFSKDKKADKIAGYKTAVNYLEVFCIYAGNFRREDIKTVVTGKDNNDAELRVDIDKTAVKALKELEEFNEMLNAPKINPTKWNAKVKEIKRLVDKIYLHRLDDVQQESIAPHLENIKKILKKR